MSQTLEVNIKTTSDVPAAMSRAQAATFSLQRQLDGIARKFGMAFKEIFIAFLGPLALVYGAIAIVTRLIAEQQQKREDANRAAIDGTNELMSAEDRYYARKRDNEKRGKENTKQAALTREEITKQFLLNDPIGRAIMERKGGGDRNRPGFLKPIDGREHEAELLAKSAEVQSAVQMAIKFQAADNPLSNKDAKDFKGPEGFGNVVGVGNNPVMEAQQAQLEELKLQTALLSQIANAGTGSVDFTKGTTPSRAALLMGK